MNEGPIKQNNLEILSQYREEVLRSYNDYLLKLKNYEKQAIDNQLNQYLLSEIEKTKIEYEGKLKITIEKFEKEIKDIQERKTKEGDPNDLLATEEKFIKNSFEREIRTLEKALESIIEIFENKIN